MPHFPLFSYVAIFIVYAMPVSGTPAGSPAKSAGEFSGYAVMENDAVRICLDTCDSSPKFGRIVSLYDKQNSRMVGDNSLFALRLGRLAPFDRKILRCTADTVLFRLGGFGVTAVSATMRYALSAKGAAMQLKVVCRERTTIPDGLTLDFQTNLTRLRCSNHLPNNFECDLDTLPRTGSIVDFEQLLEFGDGMNRLSLLLRNPFHSHFDFNALGKKCHSLIVLQCAPNSSEQGTARAFSTVGEGDTLVRDVEIYADTRPSDLVFFCEQPHGFSNSITMFWDELPNQDNWAFPTTDSATDVKYYNFLIRLLKENPAMKMGFLLLPDRIVKPPLTIFPNWKVNSPCIVSDTFERRRGAGLMMMSDSARSLVTTQTVACRPGTNYSMTYHVKTSGVAGYGAYGEVYGGDGRQLGSGTACFGDNSWQKVGFNFKTSAADTMLSVLVRMESSKGRAFFDDVSLSPYANDSNLLQNAGFDSATSGITYDNPRRHWTDAHGPERIVTHAPKQYLDFLKRIETHTKLHGWEDRVELGSHGYHHTPSLFEPDPGHEFSRYDPYGDSLRLACIFSETYRMGLTNASLRFMRSPGFEFTQSLLDILTDKGFVFFDAPYTGGLPFGAFMLQRGNRRLWLVRNAWWADVDTASTTSRLVSVLRQGHLGVVGGHPDRMFPKGADSSYRRLKGIFSSLEAAFPNLGYVFPDDYADNASAVYRLVPRKAERKKSDVVFAFYGALDSGVTVVYHGSCRAALLNGAQVPLKTNNGATYAVLPKTPPREDTLVFVNAVDRQFSTDASGSRASRGPARIVAQPRLLTGEVYNVRGQRLRAVPGLSVKGAFGIPRARLDLPGGVYIVSVKNASGISRTGRVVVP